MRRPLGILVAAIVLSLALSTVASAKFKYTHRIDLSGEIVDNWSTNDPSSCGNIGDGSLTVKFQSTGVTRIRPMISRVGGRPRSRKPGLWVLAVPGGGGFTHMGSRKGTGTYTAVDNTTQGPNTDDPGQPCTPTDKSGCGTKPLKKVTVGASGWDLKNLYASMSFAGGDFSNAVSSCTIGGLGSWTWPHDVAGGVNVYSDLLIKMPKPRTLKRQRIVVLNASDSKNSTSKRSENSPEMITDHVTRRFTVTLTKL